jgi:hypothetical protein
LSRPRVQSESIKETDQVINKHTILNFGDIPPEQTLKNIADKNE